LDAQFQKTAASAALCFNDRIYLIVDQILIIPLRN
jgi:hypothetical protein